MGLSGQSFLAKLTSRSNTWCASYMCYLVYILGIKYGRLYEQSADDRERGLIDIMQSMFWLAISKGMES